MAGLKSNQDKRALHDRWQKPGDHAKFKGISLTETTPISSRFVLRENYIKAESISVGYDFEIFYQNAAVKDLHFTGNIPRHATINEVLKFLERTHLVHFSVVGRTVIVSE